MTVPGSVKSRVDADKLCEKHNIKYKEVHFDTFRCVECEDEKRITNQELKEKAYLLRIAKETLSLPKRLESYSFENYKTTNKSKAILENCREYTKCWPDVGGLLMLGGVGTGKTHLAVSICKELCDKSICCKITTVNRIIRDVRACWGGKRVDVDEWGTSEKVTEKDVINKYVNFDLLVIDEIGSQYGSDSERIIINEIINDRYEMEKPTILIGNVSILEAEKILGTRVVDRIKDNGRLLFFEWESHRKVRK